MSLDGISAFDLISRKSMLEGLCRTPGGEQVLPFVRMFYGSPSVHLWENDSGVVHHIRQGEGGDQGDPLMPLLYSLGQHSALVSIQGMLRDGERLFAFHDDLYVVTVPNRVGAIFAVVQECMKRDANIRVRLGKIKVWNAGGIRPRACDVLQQIAEAAGSCVPVLEKVQVFQLRSRASRCWERPLDTKTSLLLISVLSCIPTRPCWNASLSFKTFSAHWLCCSTVTLHARIASCGWFDWS